MKVKRQQCGISNGYTRLSELGVDRWMAVLGARKIFSNGNIIIVNCGTAITVDWLDDMNRFQGGAILPGFELAAKALSNADGINSFRPKQSDQVVGVQTSECVQLGVFSACVGGVEKIVNNIQSKLKKDESFLLVSGGAAPLLENAWSLSDSFIIDASFNECKYDANLILRGLNKVLECDTYFES